MIPIYITLLVMNSLTEYQLNKMMLTMNVLERKNIFYHACTAILRIIWISCNAWFAISLPVFLIVLFLLLWLNIVPYRNRILLMRNLTFIIYLLYISLLMFMIGCAGLLGLEFTQLMEQPISRVLILDAAFLLHNLICFFLLHYRPEFLWKEEFDHVKVLIYTKFLFVCIVYHLADAFVLTLYHRLQINYLLLISGDLLILILMFLFLNYNQIFIRSEVIKKEYEHSEVLIAQQFFEKEALKRLSEHDPLTSAYNRREICSIMQEHLDRNKQLICVFIDIDGLKQMNDQYGHVFGDMMLKRFVTACMKQLAGEGTLARIGGDEFLLVFFDEDVHSVERKINQLQTSLIQKENEKESLYFSYGISFDEHSVEDYITNADVKMYACKYKKRGDAA